MFFIILKNLKFLLMIANMYFMLSNFTKYLNSVIEAFSDKCGTPYIYSNHTKSCYHLSNTGNWFNDCDKLGFEQLAISSEDIQNDINQLLVPVWGAGPFWVRGTNMRWVWIMGNCDIKIILLL